MMVDVDRYLDRIGYTGDRAPTESTLRELQIAHLLHVPFENLDVYFRRGVQVGAEWSYRKLVQRRRGGWCFELNGGFAALLERLGFDVERVSCRTFESATGGLSPDLDHLALLVRVDGARFLVDVGWGDNAMTPIPAEAGEYEVRPRPARVEIDDGVLRLIELVERERGERVWELQYEAALRPRELAEFDPRSRYLQTEPGLIWTERPLVTRATSAAGGRVTLHRDRLRTRGDDLTVADRTVTPEEWPDVLATHFGIAPP
jgi:N-hydroxyarylamine O-acetyltransferase